MAMAINAAREKIPFRDPQCVSALYLSKALENTEAEITVEVYALIDIAFDDFLFRTSIPCSINFLS